MSANLLIRQLRFARSEMLRCIEGVSEEDAVKRVEPMNCISWTLGHLANQEQYLWLFIAQGKALYPGLYKLVGYGAPASQPPLAEMRAVWQAVTTAADAYLDTLTDERLLEFMVYKDKPMGENTGTLLQRNIFHYWFHTGNIYAARELLGHTNLPEYVGDMTSVAYR